MRDVRFGKAFAQFTDFVLQVKTGKRALIITPDYVVMSKNIFDELSKPIGNPEIIEFNEEV
jgi:hypothetical protein